MGTRCRSTLGCWLLAAAVLAPTAPAGAVTTEQVEFTAQVLASGTATSSAAGLSLRTTIRDHRPGRARARCSSPARPLRFPKGAVVNGRFFPSATRRAARARAAGMPAGVEARLRHGARRRAADRRRRVNAKITLFNGTARGPQPADHHLRDPRPRPGDDAAGRAAQRRAARRTATSSTRRRAADQDAAERARRVGDVLRRDHARPHGAPARAHDPLHRQPGAVRRHVLPARRAVHLPGRHRRTTCSSDSRSRRPALPVEPTATPGRGAPAAPVRCRFLPRAPMRVAVISDIHSNLPALEAVLADVGSARPRPGLVPGRRRRLRRPARTPAPSWSPRWSRSAWPATTTSSCAATSTSATSR